MKPILFEAGTTTFTNNGLGRLYDAKSCKVTEERNGCFEVEMEYPVKGSHYDEITLGRIIYCTHDSTKIPEPFDIYSISEPSRGQIKVKARHISYRLSSIVSIPGIVTGTPQQIMSTVFSAAVGTNPFNFVSNVTASGTLNCADPVTIRSLLGDTDGGILDSFGGEYKWQGFTVYHYAQRGVNRGVKVRTGKNVKRFVTEGDLSEIVTGVVPWWSGTRESDGAAVYVTLPEVIITTPDVSLYPYQLTKPLDLSSVWESEPTVAELRAGANEWLARNIINTRRRVTYTVDMIPQDPVQEYLEHIELCDLVIVEDPTLGISETVEVVQTVYDVLRERYISLDIGDARRTLSYDFKMKNQYIEEQIKTQDTRNRATAAIASSAGTESHVEDQLNNPQSALAQAIANAGGGGGSGDKKAGGAANHYGVFEDYDENDNQIMTVDKDGVVLGNETDEAPTTVSEFVKSIAKKLKVTGAATSVPILEKMQVVTRTGTTYDAGAVDYIDGGDYEEIRLFLGPVSLNANTRKANASGYILIRPKQLDAATQEIEIKLGIPQNSANLNKSKIDLYGAVSAQTFMISGGGNKSGGGLIPPMLLLGAYGVWLDTSSTPWKICVAKINTRTYEPVGTTYYVTLSS